MNKKRIDYDTVKRVMALNLSVRKSIEMLNGMGIKISIGAYTKYKNEHLSNREILPIPNTKVNTSIDTAKNDSIGKVNTSDNGEKIDTIIVEYGIYKLKAISHEHRDYRRCGLSKKNLYEVLQIEELRDYQFDDLFQLRMAKINPRLVYNWKYGRCINDYDKPLN